jgi:hypothetical protein
VVGSMGEVQAIVLQAARAYLRDGQSAD